MAEEDFYQIAHQKEGYVDVYIVAVCGSFEEAVQKLGEYALKHTGSEERVLKPADIWRIEESGNYAEMYNEHVTIYRIETKVIEKERQWNTRSLLWEYPKDEVKIDRIREGIYTIVRVPREMFDEFVRYWK